MCGIAGYFGVTREPGEALETLRAMCDSLVHRGPDEEGYFHAPGIGLGMRRLSIVDLASGHQPMSSTDGAVQLVFNGEIYNYRKLRETLRRRGHTFRTQSDTEVILRQYEEQGINGIRALNGMFAIAIWDARRQRLWLVRDRLGVKPLYYRWDGQELLFGSEIKAILAACPQSPTLRPQALWDYLTLRYVPAPDTVWEQIHKLPPAHWLAADVRGNAPALTRYWDIPYVKGPRRRGRWVDEFGALFEDAVHQRMVADVPVGILLSGGLDSSAVASVASEGVASSVSMFSVGFRDCPATDEIPYARTVANHLGADHHVVQIGVEEFWDFLPDMAYYTDEPLADLASVPLYYVSRLARERVKVVLSGEGSDEVLAGYNFDRLVESWESAAAAARRPTGWRALGARLRQALGLGAGGPWPDIREASVPYAMTNYLSSEDKRAAFRGGASWPDSLDGVRRALQRLGPCHPLHQVLYTYCQDWLVEDLLMKADRMSMANSLELRTPFLDYRLVEWAARAPASSKVGRGGDGRLVTKWVLREFARRRLPSVVIERPKQGFPVPAYDWLSGPLRRRVTDLLSGAEALLRVWLEDAFIARTLLEGSADGATTLQRHRLWNLAVLEIWLRRWQSV
ncbi:MAG: asparagine synthase (glutamine-hydrolyzing) [Gammaproteobacteria bacterium]|nr:asparagine synthase (glutamine-hydrolyzing) [Gammaproteobacteria bacterium]